MHPLSFLAASVLDALPHLVGMLMVLVVLAILWGLCALVALSVRKLQPEEPAQAAPVESVVGTPTSTPVATAAPPPATADVLDSELVVVIAAAVASTVGRSHRVVSIKPAGSEWEKAGRQSVLSSHRIR